MLIQSTRITPNDVAVWHERARADAVYASLKSFRAKCDKALSTSATFARSAPCYASVSWGKDSMVIAHLAIRLRETLGIVVPIVWVRVEPIKNPDCIAVRDEFLRRFDHPYREQTVWCRQDDEGWHATGTLQKGFHDAEKILNTKRSLRGIRGAESGTRKYLMERRGQFSKNSCRPIGFWSGQDVFAYLHAFDLPIHPAYAMSFGGMLDRDRLRVSSIGGKRGGGMGRDAWEAKYYGPELAEALGGHALVDQLT